MKYIEYTQKIRQFQRTSVLASAADVAWFSWNNSSILKSPETSQGRGLFLARAYGGRIAAISAATGNEHRNKTANNDTIVQLSRSFLEIQEPIMESDILTTQEFIPLLTSLRKSNYFKDFVSDEQLVRHCSVQFFLCRLLRSQSEPSILGERDIISTWGILKIFFKNEKLEIQSKMTKFLQVEPLATMRSGLCLLAMFSHKNSSNPPGRLDLNGSTVWPDIKEILNLDLDVLTLIANRWGWTCSDFKEWHDDVLKLPEHQQKYAPNPLVRAPFIKLDPSFAGVTNSQSTFVAPSPWHIIWKTKFCCIETFSDFLPENESMTAQSILGDATSEFLNMALIHICGTASVVKLDEMESAKGKRADFAVLVGEYAIIIECKKSVASAETKALHSPSEVVTMWEKIAEGFLQCSASLSKGSLKNTFPQIKKYISVVCINDSMIAEGGVFNIFAHNSNWYANHNIAYPEFATLEEFLGILVKLGPELFASEVVKRWDQIRISRSSLDHNFSNYYSKVPRPEKPFSDHSYLEELEMELFPFTKKSHFGKA